MVEWELKNNKQKQIYSQSPQFGTRCSLTLDIAIASYTINPFSFLFSIIYYTGISTSKGMTGVPSPSYSGSYRLKRRAPYGAPIDQLCIYSPQGPYTTVGSTGGDTVKILRVSSPMSWRWSTASILPIWFTRTLWNYSDLLHTMLLPPRRWPPQPPGLNLIIYNTRDGCGFDLLQAIRDVQIRSYDLMFLTETNIPNSVYFQIRLGYKFVCS